MGDTHVWNAHSNQAVDVRKSAPPSAIARPFHARSMMREPARILPLRP